MFKDLQARFREREKEKAELYTADINDQINKKRTEYELKMKQVVDNASLDYEVHRQSSNFRIQDAYTRDETKIAKIREDINIENNKYSIDTMKQENATNMQIAEDNSALKIDRIEFDKKHSSLDRKKWNAQHDLNVYEQEHELQKKKLTNDLNNKFELMDFELETKNLKEDILKYRAFNNTKDALSGRVIHTRSSKVEANDFMNNAARAWFTQKSSQSK